MTAKSNCTAINTDFKKVFLPSVYVLVFIIGLAANCWGLKSMLVNWKKLGNVRIFVLNLGVADLLHIITLPFLAYYENKKWIFGSTFCKMTRFCFNLNLYGSIGFLTCISLYRYLGIVHTMRFKGRISSHHCVAQSILVWLLVCVQITPDMYFEKIPPSAPYRCFDTALDKNLKQYFNYSIGWTIVGFCVPLLIILGCYGHVALVLSRKDNLQDSVKERSLRYVVTLAVLFSVCFIPFHVFRLLNLKTRILKAEGTCQESFKSIYVAHQICRGLVCLNSAINPVVYLFLYNDAYVQFLRMKERVRKSLGRLSLVALNSTSRTETPESPI
ncbi:P2Y purinoceptor 1-like [Scleropages formosus]|uniref:p2Y purinoceptor 1-like n=1 Tax=Scleropages formosus TaxID=113540 RepID=A0A0P7TMD2_SCLFO|nr:P2Y purinoceptor 1-like [Scleropages formosus]